ncbi:MAG TPA: xanthine dehydrogenase family protein molybdopterin-binding subunit [Methylomirabilota bacterium]|nr:xanthine dehydrogenase family protein molybdopterin-binding subunit [Methylomirabilota bacterium]
MSASETSLRFGAAGGGRRSEDGPLLTGRGRFTDDLDLPGQAHAAFARATMAHGLIRAIDTTRARALPGVLAVYTGRDLAAAGLGGIPPAASFPGRGGRPLASAPIPPLAVDRVRFVGEAVAIAVAETAAQAADAAAAVVVEFDPLPAAADVERALAAGAPAIWPEAPGNVAFDWTDGDPDAVDAAFRAAAHVARVRLHDTRLAPAALEPRAAIGQWDGSTQRYTLTASTQGVAVVRRLLVEGVFKIPPQALRVVTRDVGGGFGMKVQAYPEYAALLFAARGVDRPVKWRASRLESFLADTAGRDGILEGELAIDAAGRFLGLRARTRVGLGAYVSAFAAVFGTNNTKNCLSSVYRIPVISIDVVLAFTNAAPLGPYRGAGRPEALYLIERLIDQAATDLGIDRVELRRRNLIAPAAMPYRTPNGPVYDSGEFETVMDRALALADWKGFPQRRATSERGGRLRGIGLCCFLEVAGGILDEVVDLRFGPDGTVALHTGAQPMGQGHLSTFPPLIAARLGIDASQVRLVQGDSDLVPAGTPSVASRSMMMAGSAAAMACDAAIDKGRRAAAHYFEAALPDVEFSAGRFRVRGTDRAIGLLDLAARARTLPNVPADLADGLDATAKFVSPQMSFPNGCHVTEVEVDPETGRVVVVGYAAVDDVGRIVHETIVEGQIHGGIAQGLGQVLGEHVIYDEHGQLLTASFMDYLLPRADDLPALRVGHHAVPCTTNPLGVKGAGESGVAGALPSAVNAVLDALASRGISELDLPMSPARVWTALQRGTR